MKLLALCASLALAGLTSCAQDQPVRILIAYHSETGNTEELAKAVQRGASSVPRVEVLLRGVAEVTPEEIIRSDGIVVGSPVHWQSHSAETKRFLDRIAEVLLKHGKTIGEGRIAGAFCTGGAVASGKDLARVSILTAFLGMRFLVIGGVDEEGFGTLGPQATTGPVAPGISQAEREEARRFGERFARLTGQMRSTSR